MFAQLIALTAICVFSQTLTEKMHQGPLIGGTASINIATPVWMQDKGVLKKQAEMPCFMLSLTVQSLGNTKKSDLAKTVYNSISQNASSCSFYTANSIHSIKIKVLIDTYAFVKYLSIPQKVL